MALRASKVAAITLVILSSLSACAEYDARRNRETFEGALKKAEQGDRDAAVRLGGLYRLGIGTPPDPQQALHWYEMAESRAGWAALGAMYDRGDGVPSDPDRAALYYRRAAETREPISMYSLGCLHAEHRIAAPDAVAGYTWLLLAQKIGDSSLTCHAAHYECREWAIKDRPGCRARLGAALTPEQRAEAERRAAAWLAAHPPRGR